MSAASLSAHAAVVGQFDPLANTPDYKWVNNGTGGEFFTVNSTSDTTAQGVNTQFTFLDAGFTSLKDLPATLTIDATAGSGNPAVLGSAGTFTQTGLDGSFSIVYNGTATTIGGFNLTPGENLLSGTFNGAWIQGAGGSGSTNVTEGNGGSANFTSSILSFSNVDPASEEFAFNLLAVSPNFSAASGQALRSFTANGGGNFSDTAMAVPEPATWGLMILGFGGAGALLRSRRRTFVRA
jgi:hypothetical protein